MHSLDLRNKFTGKATGPASKEGVVEVRATAISVFLQIGDDTFDLSEGAQKMLKQYVEKRSLRAELRENSDGTYLDLIDTQYGLAFACRDQKRLIQLLLGELEVKSRIARKKL
jgi:hypothetical protein